MNLIPSISFFFFFNDKATTEIYTLTLHDALPISRRERGGEDDDVLHGHWTRTRQRGPRHARGPRHHETSRSEEHTSELQSRSDLVCRLLLEKKKKNKMKEETSTRQRDYIIT